MKKTGVFLQVRLDSSRLPRKALLPLMGKAVISHAMEALKEIDADVFALLTDEDSEKELRPYAERSGFQVFTGPKEDVLERYALAAEKYQVDTIIRSTGDNPLVSGQCAGLLLKLHHDKEADYSGFRDLPLGTGVECVKTGALLKARIEARAAYDHEHVCPYLYNHPESFIIYRPVAPRECRAPQLRVTLDTMEDFNKLEMIYRELYRDQPIRTDILVKKIHHLCFITG